MERCGAVVKCRIQDRELASSQVQPGPAPSVLSLSKTLSTLPSTDFYPRRPACNI